MLQAVSIIGVGLRGRSHVPVKIVEEGEEVEAELEKALLLVPRQRAEDLRSVVHVVFVAYPEAWISARGFNLSEKARTCSHCTPLGAH